MKTPLSADRDQLLSPQCLATCYLDHCIAQPSDTAVNLLHTLSSTKKEDFDLGQFCSLESMGILPAEERDDHVVFLENYLNTSITRNSDGSCTAKFPWNEDAPPLPSNYSSCTRRARALLTHPISLKPTMTSSMSWKGEVL